MNRRAVKYLLLTHNVTIILTVFLCPSIKQNQQNHLFADQRVYFSIPNFWNVISNFLFCLVGTSGILYLLFQWILLLSKLTFIYNLGACRCRPLLFLKACTATGLLQATLRFGFFRAKRDGARKRAKPSASHGAKFTFKIPID